MEKNCSKVVYAEAAAAQQETATRRTRGGNILYAKTGAKVPARLVLYFLSWSGFLVSFMMRNDINFALVAMTRSETSEDVALHTTTGTSSGTSANNHSTLQPSAELLVTSTIASVAAEFLSAAQNNSAWQHPKSLASTIDADHRSDMYQYAWSSAAKSIIVSSFYWCYVLSQVVGGIATQYFGTKHVFGWSQFATALCSLCMPNAADLHYGAVIALRSVQGFASGLTWPAMYALVGVWIPLSERSRFMSSFQGFSIGIGLTYPLCGFLIAHLGWRSIFYTTGSLGMLWSLMWYLLAFNTPRDHPRISQEELDYIELSAPCSPKHHESSHGSMKVKVTVPWRHIFLSPPAWAIGITTFGRIWIHYIFIVCGPTFMKNILKFDYKANGFLSGLPFICSYVSSVLFCYVADKMVLLNWLNLTQVRKLFTAASQIIPGILIYTIGYIDQSIALLLFVWFVAVTFITAAYAGAMANIVDIAPNFAGPVLAFCQTIHMSASFISPLVSGLLVTNESSIEQWRTVFGISSAVTILTYAVFQIYGTAEIQKWNYAPVSPDDEAAAEEMMQLKKEQKGGREDDDATLTKADD